MRREPLEPALVLSIYLLSAVLAGLTSLVAPRRRLADLVALSGCVVALVLDAKMVFSLGPKEAIIYKFGGFPPPLGVTYVVDRASALMATLSAFSAVITFLHLTWSMKNELRYYFYVLALLLMAGVHGCLFTGDMFNLYVSVELVAIASYALTGLLRESPLATRAALIYGISGMTITSFLFLSVILLYGSYGTLNMADIALKARHPDAIVAFSGRIHGDIVLTSKVSLALITWILLFKSGIMPNHFWLPEVYRSAPIQAVALFTSSADIVGVCGILRLYSTVFSGNTVLREFLGTFLTILMVICGVSAVVSSILVSRQRTVRRLVAYSTITQFSLSLLGVAANNPEALAGSLLNVVANGLGDMLVLYGAHAIKYTSAGRSRLTPMLARVALVVGLLNLFGVLPVLPGFWAKTFLTSGLLKAGLPPGAAVVLASAGLCAAGYFQLIFKFLGRGEAKALEGAKDGGAASPLPTLILGLLLLTTVGAGVALLALEELRTGLLSEGALVIDAKTYVELVLWHGR